MHMSIFSSMIVFVRLIMERLCGSLHFIFFNFGGACEDIFDLHMGRIYCLLCWNHEKCGTEWEWDLSTIICEVYYSPLCSLRPVSSLAELLDRNSHVVRRTCDVWRESGCGWSDDAVPHLKSVLTLLTVILSNVSSAGWNVRPASFSHDYISAYNVRKLLIWLLRISLVWKERKSHGKQEFRRKLAALRVCRNEKDCCLTFN